MTQAAVAEDRAGARLSLFVWRRRWLSSTVVYLILVTLCAVAGYWLMFSQFAAYDDEGFFDYSLKLFVGGHPLYSSVFSDYGPFYYLVFGGVFAITGHGVTTDAGRLIQLTIWIIVSLGLGLTAHRLTGRLTLGVVALATSFLLLNGLTSEPMHPGALVCALLTAMAAVIAFGLRHRARGALIAVGAIAAALVLTKINVGGYAMISIAFATIMAGRSLVRYRVVRRLAVALFVLVGPALMASKLNSGWARSYALLAVTSTVALVFVALPTTIDPAVSDESGSWPRYLIAGFASCLVVVLGVVFALGTSPGDLIDQTVVVPLHQGSVLVEPISLDSDVTWWSLAAVGLAWTWRRVARAAPHRPPNLWEGLLRTLAGVAILLSLGNESLFSIVPNATFSLAMPLAWIAALPSRRDAYGPREPLVRLLIPSLAVLQALVAYPVAGTQVLLGSILLVLCGVVCLADGWSELTAWNALRRPGNVAATAAIAGLFAALFATLALGGTFEDIVQPLEVDHDGYVGNAPLRVPGATRLRLNAAQGPAIDQAVALLRSRCRTLISLPGLYSFNIWTGLPTPSPFTGEQPYWRLLSSGQQTRVLAAAEASQGLCAVREDSLAAGYGVANANSPLVRYINRDFVPIGQFPPYVVEMRRR